MSDHAKIAQRLNVVSDQLTQKIRHAEEYIEKLHLGVEGEISLKSGQKLEYKKVNEQWGLWVTSPKMEPIRLSSASRELRIAVLSHDNIIKRLIQGLVDDAEELTKQVESVLKHMEIE